MTKNLTRPANLVSEPISHIDWPAVRGRLASVADVPEVITGVDRLAKSGELDDAFMAAVVAENISLDWLILGEGRPGRAA